MDNIVANFTSLDGRIGRQSWWIGVVILIVVNIIISFLILPLVGISMMPNFAALMADPNNADPAAISAAITATMRTAGWVSLVIFLIFLYPSACLSIKRRHDKDNSGLDVWIYFGLTALLLLVQALGLFMTRHRHRRHADPDTVAALHDPSDRRRHLRSSTCSWCSASSRGRPGRTSTVPIRSAAGGLTQLQGTELPVTTAAGDPVPLLKTLIACPSVTPETAGVLDVLDAALTPLGFTVERLRFEGGGSYPVDNLFATRGHWRQAPALCGPHRCRAARRGLGHPAVRRRRARRLHLWARLGGHEDRASRRSSRPRRARSPTAAPTAARSRSPSPTTRKPTRSTAPTS